MPSGILPPKPRSIVDGAFTGEANFGFNFTCEMTAKNKAVIKGQITYHDTGTSEIGTEVGIETFRPIRLHGVVDPIVHHRRDMRSGGPDLPRMRPSSRAPTGPRTTGLTLGKLPGRFTVLVFDQGEPGVSRDPAFVTGDGFAIELAGGPYTVYTRAGYIEGGNIQVDPN